MRKVELRVDPLSIWEKDSNFRTVTITERETTVEENREIYLKELRSGKWKKGCIKSDVIRAGGECICQMCHQPYSFHPSLAKHSWVTVLCDGSLVKL